MVKEETKQYHNEELQKILEKDLTEYRYGEFAGILQDIFQRRAFEFNYSNEEMKEQLDIFLSRVKRIKVVSKKDMSRNSDEELAGRYITGRKAIEFNREYYEKVCDWCKGDKEKIGQVYYEILAHEAFHAISHRSMFELGLTKAVGIGGFRTVSGTVMNEAFTEVAASRISKNRSDLDFTNRAAPTTSYGEITFIPSVIAYTVGCSEREILSKGLVGRKELEELVCSKFPKENHEDVINYLSKLDLHLDALYKISTDKAFLETERGKSLFKRQLVEITDASHQMLDLQLRTDDRPVDGKKAGEYSFRVKALNRVINNHIIRFLNSQSIDRELFDEISSEMEAKTQNKATWRRCNNIRFVAYLKEQGVPEEDRDTVLSYIYDDTFLDREEEIKAKTGIGIAEYNRARKENYDKTGRNTFLEDEDFYEKKVKEEDYHKLDETKNKEMFINVTNVLDSIKNKFNFFDITAAIADVMKRISKTFSRMERRLFLLPPEPAPKYKYDEDSGYDSKGMSDFDKELRVDIDFKKATEVKTEGKKKDDSELSL